MIIIKRIQTLTFIIEPCVNGPETPSSSLFRTRPALCYCSVLIRAVLAVLISHWSSHVTSSLTHHPQQLDVTVKVLDLMAVGQFIPAQLALVPHIIHILDPFQLHCILIGKISSTSLTHIIKATSPPTHITLSSL